MKRRIDWLERIVMTDSFSLLKDPCENIMSYRVKRLSIWIRLKLYGEQEL